MKTGFEVKGILNGMQWQPSQPFLIKHINEVLAWELKPIAVKLYPTSEPFVVLTRFPNYRAKYISTHHTQLFIKSNACEHIPKTSKKKKQHWFSVKATQGFWVVSSKYYNW